MEPKYKRVLLKLSGEALAGNNRMGIDYDTVLEISRAIKESADLGTEIAIVVGGGNFWRGRSSGKMDRTRADHMGMLATVINALALCDALESLDVDVRVQTAISMASIAEPYIRNRAVRHLEKGRVVIFGCGVGSRFSPPTPLHRCVLRRSERTSSSRPLWWMVYTIRTPTSTTMPSVTRTCRSARCWQRIWRSWI